MNHAKNLVLIREIRGKKSSPRLSAELSHWDNSTFLMNNSQQQEAAYLAGYAAECALKALIEKGDLLGKGFGHSLAGLSKDGLELALLLNPLLRRYPISPVVMQSPVWDNGVKPIVMKRRGF